MGIGSALCFCSTMECKKCLSDPAVNLHGSSGHTVRAVVLAHALRAAATEFIGTFLVAPQRENSLGQTVYATRLDQNSATGFVDHFGEHTVMRLNHRHLVCHGFEREGALRFSI